MNMIGKIKRRIKKIIFKNSRLSYSQSGEDMILDTIFCKTQKGFYIDIGANNPFNQSNTHYFYKKGWRGINVDALPGSMKLFKKYRSGDINIEAAISNTNEELTYFMFTLSFYNTFDVDKYNELKDHFEFIGKKKIKTIKLSELLDGIKFEKIDFLSIDVEGLDYEVLCSNDWEKYRPKVIITECLSGLFEFLNTNKVYQLLKEKGYILFCNSPTNAFYLESEFYKERFESKNQIDDFKTGISA